ncbi:MAG: hypothetical protein II779_16560, partial [Clostridia bacterium]|nr:hypothetical protein [Clostridia bacterium]
GRVCEATLVGHEMVPRAAVPRRDIKSETRSVSYLISLREGMNKPSSADGSVDAVTKPVDTVTGMSVMLISKGAIFQSKKGVFR